MIDDLTAFSHRLDINTECYTLIMQAVREAYAESQHHCIMHCSVRGFVRIDIQVLLYTANIVSPILNTHDIL